MEQRLFLQQDYKPVNKQYKTCNLKNRNAYSDFQSEVILTGESVSRKVWSMKFARDSSHPPISLE